MQELTFRQLQDYLLLKYDEKASSTGLFMKLVEEIGETAEVLNKLEGRKLDDGASLLEEELADIIHYTVAIASINGIDITNAIIEKDRVASTKYNQKPNLGEFLGN